MFRSRGARLGVSFLAVALTTAAHAQTPAPARYVAMGSSFAAGPGVTESADTPPNNCARSVDNYPHQLARKRHLDLADVSCNAATTTNVLEGQGKLPPQIDALTPDTKLVTITIGGNDVSYMGGLISSSCRHLAGDDAAAAKKCNQSFDPTEDHWTKVEAGMDRIIAEVRRRSPAARLIFVDYLTALPEHGVCAGLPLAPADADKYRTIAKRLVEVTARAAHRGKADLIQASALSRDHNVCSPVRWSLDYHPMVFTGGHLVIPYHPTLEGMTGIAAALDKLLGRWRG